MINGRKDDMPTNKITDTEIAIRVVPRHLRWPEARTNIAWMKAHACVDALRDLIRNVDFRCLEAEQNRELSAGGIGRRRTEICDQALRKLANFAAFEIAEKALTENFDALERLCDPDPQDAQMRDKLKQALRDLREGMEATRRMVQERCRVRETASV
jgi:hypothetical protein